MQSTQVRFWRSPPILLAALIGALIGIASTLIVELGGVFHINSSAAILMLPSSTFAAGISETGIMRTALIMLIECVGNMLGYALLLAIPTAVIVAICHIFRRRAS